MHSQVYHHFLQPPQYQNPVLLLACIQKNHGVTQADVIEDLAMESCVELSSNTIHQQVSITDDGSFFENHPITPAV